MNTREISPNLVHCTAPARHQQFVQLHAHRLEQLPSRSRICLHYLFAVVGTLSYTTCYTSCTSLHLIYLCLSLEAARHEITMRCGHNA